MPATPTPISDYLRAHLETSLSQIKTGKSGNLTVGASLQGIEVSLGQRWRFLTASAFAAREWQGSWQAGARVTVDW